MLTVQLLNRLSTRHPSARLTTPSSAGTSFASLLGQTPALCAALLLLLALALRIPLMERGFSGDEAITAKYSVETESIWHTISDINTYNNHIGYSLSARLSQALFGRFEWSTRLPALILGVLGIYMLWSLARDVLSSRLAIIPPLLLCLSPAHIAWSTSGRGYSGLIFFTTAATYFYLRLLRSPSRRDGILFVLASTLGIYFHLYAGLVIIAQALYWLYNLNIKRVVVALKHCSVWPELRMFIVCLGSVVLLSTVLYAPALRFIIAFVRYSERGPFRALLAWDIVELVSGTDWPLPAIIILAVSLIGMVTFQRHNPDFVYYCAWLLILPFTLVLVRRPIFAFDRFFLYWLPYYLIFFTIGSAHVWGLARAARPAVSRYVLYTCTVGGSILILAAWALSWGRWPEEVMRTGLREASIAYLRETDDTVGLCLIGFDVMGWQYYIDRPLFKPASTEELLEFSHAYAEVRCVATYPYSNNQPPSEKALVRFLDENGEHVKIMLRDVFIWKPRP
jgi:hypothetical protein